MTIEPISDERLAEIRARADEALAGGCQFFWVEPDDILALLSRLDKAEALMLELRAFIVANADDLSMHSKAVALSDRVNNHPPPPPSES